ncbi:unnamed protein product [Mycena citricolor]|uniref:Uncharacterized protein n=1 Tax=Mycena citricolor TaxID=2018698 RepID=A0AAD2GSD4_9AGAR|nr:unnamed protein product [Mycena citricolor]
MSTTTTQPTQTTQAHGVHPSAIGSNTVPPQTSRDDVAAPTQETPSASGPAPTGSASGDVSSTNNAADDSTKPPGSGEVYPEQKHAGAGFADKVTALKEQVVGKVTKNPELVTKGHDRWTGELKKKELDADAVKAQDPFANPEEKEKEKVQEKEGIDAAPSDATTKTSPTTHQLNPTPTATSTASQPGTAPSPSAAGAPVPSSRTVEQ